MTNEEFAKCLDNAEKIVASWPEWKRNAIVSWIDGLAANETPSPYVDNFNGENDVY